jgi:hypothetical protein
MKTLKVGVCDGVITFSEGNIGRIRVFEQLGVKPGISALHTLEDMDKLRVGEVELAAQIMTRSKKMKKEKVGC